MKSRPESQFFHLYSNTLLTYTHTHTHSHIHILSSVPSIQYLILGFILDIEMLSMYIYFISLFPGSSVYSFAENIPGLLVVLQP